MNTRIVITVAGTLAALGALSSAAGAQPAVAVAPLMHQTFETDPGAWTAMGDGAKVSITHEAENVKEGMGALQFDYPVKAGQSGLLITGTPDGLPTNLRSIRFWVKTDHNTTLAMVAQEKNGGRYFAMFHAPKGAWQRVEIEPADFMLGDGKDDPKDPDNKLDLDQVEGVGLADISQFFIQNPQMAQMLSIQAGPHTLYLDDLDANLDAAPAAAAPADGSVTIDAFTRPQLNWIAPGDMNLSLSKNQVMDGPALQADYRQSPNHLSAVIRGIRPGKLAGTKHLLFDIASLRPISVVVQVEETSGGKYNSIIQVPGDAQPKSMDVSLLDMNQSDDSKDNDNKLDLDQIKTVLFIDATGFLGGVTGSNTLLLGKLRATP